MINPSRDPDEELVQQYLLSKKELFEGLKKLQHRHSHHDATLASTSTFSYLQEALELLKKEPMGQRMVLSNYDHALWYRSAELHLITRTLSRVLISQGIMLLYDSLPKDSNEGFASSPQERKAAGTHMQQLIRDAASVGMPQQLRTEALANATSSLCRFWVTRKYGAYDRIESGSHQSQSPMALIKAEVLSTFCPIADHFAQLAREPGQKPVHFAPNSSRYGTGAQTIMPHHQPDDNVSRSHRVWQDYAMSILGRERARQAWEISHLEDETMRNHLLSDLAEIAASPEGRESVNAGLQSSFQKHLLHAGSSTVDILDTFVLIIQLLTTPLASGKRIDETGVLLDLAAHSFRGFLKARDDSARIVIQSLLDPKPGTDGDPPPSDESFSGRISMAMYHQANPHATQNSYEGQDLLDINWIPKPVDARATHGDNTSKDDIGHVTSIQDDSVFIRELEDVLSERLLRTEHEHFRLEQRLLKMFRARFDDETGDKTLLQRSDTMLWDIMQSLEVNDQITKKFRHPDLPDLQVRVLSLESWHNLKDREMSGFRMPMNSVNRYWTTFLEAFEELAEDERYLEGLHELGRMTVELELEDRTIKEEVTPPQASVLYAFSEDYVRENYDEMKFAAPGKRTVQELAPMLEMPEALVRESLAFWIGKLVLRQLPEDKDSYIVMETLSAEEEKEQAANAADVQAEMEESAEASSHQERLQAHAETYSAYITGMLTNLGSMPAGDMHQTLTSVVPGGFAFDLNDLEALLQDMASKGEVEMEGIMWKAKLDDAEMQ